MNKADFPIFKNNPGLIYLDSTATSLKPQSVIDKETEYYRQYSANVFRGVYEISEKATQEFEETRKVTAEFINAAKTEEVIFTRNTTESINLLAYSLGRKIVNQGDEIVTTIMEHHSNFVPWQVLAGEVGATLKIIDIDNDGYLNLFKGSVKKTIQEAKLKEVINRKTKIFALTYISNVLGTINPVKEIIKAARKINSGIIVIVDAAQAVPHLNVDVRDLDCDFIAFSSHKMLGPTGVGVLWGRYRLLEEMFPFNYGGEMINEVYIDRTTFQPPPLKFEAGTPNISGVIAFKEAIRYLNKTGMLNIRDHEKSLVSYVLKKLTENFPEKIKILGPDYPEERGGVIAFTFNGFHPHDIAQILDENNIAIRVGHHCAMPLHERLGIPASCRISFYIYNETEDVDKLINGLKKVEQKLR